MADGTYGGYSAEGYGGYGYGGGYGGESGGYGWGSSSPWGDAAVNIGGLNIDPYSGQDYNPAWGSVIGTLIGGPIGGLLGNLGVRGYNAISGTTTPQSAVSGGWNLGYGVNPSEYGPSPSTGGANDVLGALAGGPDMGLGPTGGGWGSGNYLANVAGLAGINYQNPTPEQYQWLNSLPQPAKPSAVSMIVDQTMPWIDRDAAGNITGSYRWKQREGQEKLTW